MNDINMKISISKRNSALGTIPSINLPAVVTCRPDAPCAHLCYACKGNFIFDNVQRAHAHNLNMWALHPTFFEKSIYTSAFMARYFRWHSSGDIVNARYLDMMVRIARQLPATKFLAYTKKFELVNAWIDQQGELPNNLTIVFSAWDKNFSVPNPHRLPVAYVAFKDATMNPEIPTNAVPCYKQTVRGGTCEQCVTKRNGGCWAMRPGEAVVFKQH